MVLRCVCCGSPAVVNVARDGNSAWFCAHCAGKVLRLPGKVRAPSEMQPK